MSEQPGQDPPVRQVDGGSDGATGAPEAGSITAARPIPQQPASGRPPTVIAAPTGLTATAVPGDPMVLPAIALVWTGNGAVSAGGTWCLDRSTDPRFTADLTAVRTRTTAARYVDDTVVPGVAYSYRVRVETAGAWSTWSNTASAVVSVPAPTGLRAVVPTTAPLRVELRWVSQSLATGVELQRAVNPTFTAGVVTAARLAGASCTDDRVAQNTTYYYRVRSTLRGAASPWSNVSMVTTPGPPDPPTALAADQAAGPRTVQLAWRQPVTSVVAGFVVHRAVDRAFTAELATFSLPAASRGLTDSGLRPATSYSYRVAAFNVAGISPFSTSITIDTVG